MTKPPTCWLSIYMTEKKSQHLVRGFYKVLTHVVEQNNNNRKSHTHTSYSPFKLYFMLERQMLK